jgi:hypothetical protein
MNGARWPLMLALVACGCGGQRTDYSTLELQVSSELLPPGEIDEVFVVATTARGDWSHHFPLVDGTGGPATSLPLSLALTPSGDPRGTIQIAVSGLLAGSEVVFRKLVVSGFSPGKSRVLRVNLERACYKVHCDYQMEAPCPLPGCATAVVKPEDLPLSGPANTLVGDGSLVTGGDASGAEAGDVPVSIDAADGPAPADAGEDVGRDGPADAPPARDVPPTCEARMCSPISDGCCPSACNAKSDSDCAPVCGNGVREGSEMCDGADCPTSCASVGCTKRTLVGSASTCDAHCVDTAVTACVSGDGCCPGGCTAANDKECDLCGNGKLDPGETCDPLSTCPTSCPPLSANPCMLRKLINQGTCQAACVDDRPQSACMGGDMCCPSGCNNVNDGDCAPKCGNSVIESGETCEPPTGPAPACAGLMAGCHDDADFVRVPSGDPQLCTFKCTTTPRACGPSDLFCPSGCPPAQDPDCKMGAGAACGSGADCVSGSCPDGFCCVEACSTCQACTGAGGKCVNITMGNHDNVPAGACTGGSVCNGLGACKKLDGQSCAAASDCLSNACTNFFVDADGDHYGVGAAIKLCGSSPPAGYWTSATPADCCDSDAKANPGYNGDGEPGIDKCNSWDYNCNGKTDYKFPFPTGGADCPYPLWTNAKDCQYGAGYAPGQPAVGCGETAQMQLCSWNGTQCGGALPAAAVVFECY